MYAVTIRLSCADEADIDTVRTASRAVVGPSRAEPGCLFFDVLFDSENPGVVRFYEAYVSRAAFDAHLAATHTKRWAELCMPLLDRSTVRLPESVSEGVEIQERVVVVFGATGRIGSEMVRLLATEPRCHEVRALSRRPEALSARRLTGYGSSVRVLSSELDALDRACVGATDAFVVAPLLDEMEAWHVQVAGALAAAGVKHVVKVSVTGARPPDTDPPPGRFPSLHWAGEEALRKAGLRTSVIRPTIFMQHFEMGTGVYERGDARFYLPTGDAEVAFLDCRDIAAMGHGLLFSPHAAPFRGGAYELTGPEALKASRIASLLSAIRGESVQHVDGAEAFEARCTELGKPDWGKFVYAEAAGGWFSAVETDVFETVVGRRPRSFGAWADERALWFRD